MIAINKPELQVVFDNWMDQGSDAPPTNGDIVRYDKIDIDLLHHLASYVWEKAEKHFNK